MRSSIDDTYMDIKIQFSADKKRIRVFSSEYGEYTNNLFDELNTFLEYDFSIIYRHKTELKSIYDEISTSSGDFSDLYKYQNYIEICFSIAEAFENKLPGLTLTLKKSLEDRFSLTDYLTIDLVSAMDEIWYELENILIMQKDLNDLFYTLAEEQLNNADRSKVLSSQHSVCFVTDIELSYDCGNLVYTIIANTPQQFYATLSVFYFSSQPLVALCQYCGRYFTPKTKKVTLYCDRATNNSTCKKEGARIKHKNKIASDPVLHKFYSEKHRRYMQCERTPMYDNGYSSFELYYDWLDKVELAKTKYLKAQISDVEFLETIYELDN